MESSTDDPSDALLLRPTATQCLGIYVCNAADNAVEYAAFSARILVSRIRGDLSVGHLLVVA
jgi:hypothetical protein